MLKQKPWLYLFMIMVFSLSGCELVSSTKRSTMATMPTSTPIPIVTSTPLVLVRQLPSPTSTNIQPTITLTPSSIQTLVDTLEPEKARERIKTLLQEPGDCAAPCFWGIEPGQTTTDDARNIFSQFGLQTVIIPNRGKDYYNFHYGLDSGLLVSGILTTQNKLVENLQLKIHPEHQKAGIKREWFAYSPETLIKRYGMPSKVDFSADWGPSPIFLMQMYFDDRNLIVQYSGDNIVPKHEDSSRVCPLTAQFEAVWIWMGKNPEYPPGQGVSLEKATSMTIDEFSKLMIGDPTHSCFTIKGDAFQ